MVTCTFYAFFRPFLLPSPTPLSTHLHPQPPITTTTVHGACDRSRASQKNTAYASCDDNCNLQLPCPAKKPYSHLHSHRQNFHLGTSKVCARGEGVRNREEIGLISTVWAAPTVIAPFLLFWQHNKQVKPPTRCGHLVFKVALSYALMRLHSSCMHPRV